MVHVSLGDAEEMEVVDEAAEFETRLPCWDGFAEDEGPGDCCLFFVFLFLFLLLCLLFFLWEVWWEAPIKRMFKIKSHEI